MGLLLPSLAALLDRLPDVGALPDDTAAVAVFDADHTLWDGDIGDTAFAAAVDAGLVHDATWRGPVRAWASQWSLALPENAGDGVRAILDAAASGTLAQAAAARGGDEGAWKASLYGMQAWVYAGHRRDVVADFGARLFRDGFAARLWSDMKELVTALRARGLTVRIASASHGALVEPGAALLGLAREHVQGMEPAVDDDGRTLPRIDVDTFGPGKARAVQAALGGKRPLLAFGDSVLATDRELLALAVQGVGVATKGAHRAAALAHPSLWLFDPRA